MKPSHRRLAALGSLLALCACSLNETSAERFARDRAELLGRKMTIQPVRDYTSRELVRRVQDEQDVTFLRADGRPRDNNVAIQAKIYAKSHGGGWLSGTEATLCFEWRIGEYGDGWDRPKEIDCPEVPPLVLPQPPLPKLPDDAVDRVTSALRALDRADLATVRTRAMTNVGVDGVVGGATEDQGWIGFALHAGWDCLMGRVQGEIVEAWVPPAQTVQPREVTCDNLSAAQGLAKPEPQWFVSSPPG